MTEELVQAAREARKQAFAPFSQLQVGELIPRGFGPDDLASFHTRLCDEDQAGD